MEKVSANTYFMHACIYRKIGCTPRDIACRQRHNSPSSNSCKLQSNAVQILFARVCLQKPEWFPHVSCPAFYAARHCLSRRTVPHKFICNHSPLSCASIQRVLDAVGELDSYVLPQFCSTLITHEAKAKYKLLHALKEQQVTIILHCG